MPNVFLLYMPSGNHEAIVHYEDTIKNMVGLERISRFLAPSQRAQLVSVFGSARIAVWGSSAGAGNRSKFEKMSIGDDVLIVEGKSIRAMGKVAGKTENLDLSRELWKPINGKRDTDWRLVYFIANSRELDVPFSKFCDLFGYSSNLQLRGFTTVSPDRLKQFYAKYDDLYSVLERIQLGERVAQRNAAALTLPGANDLAPIGENEIDAVLNTPAISDHVRMQWTLARLGLKAGERVWVPAGDQSRLRQTYDFESFDPEFSTGIDLPPSYLENIDVVWKQQFRIGAAYEIENSTSIYSGLLRFADLNIVAPNTLYPMFIVAPREKKNRLRVQLQRPAFRRLELDNKVRFLPYETIEEIDRFFANSDSGLSVDLIVGRSESVL